MKSNTVIVFPLVKIYGCYYHYVARIDQKSIEYKVDDQELKQLLKQLPFIESEFRVFYVWLLKKINPETNCVKLANYWLSYWGEPFRLNMLSLSDKPPYLSTKNNAVESFNEESQKLFTRRPTLENLSK